MEENKTQLELANSSLVEENALAKINDYMKLGMTLPQDFNPANSLKKARLILNEMSVNGKSVFDVCSKSSIMQCLVDSCTMGLDYSLNQIYFIPRGNKMTNLESYFGRITRMKRVSPNYKPIVRFVKDGDVFIYEYETETGLTKIVKHETKIENFDNPIKYAYTYVTDADGITDVFIMSKKQWLTSWNKSPNKCVVAKEYEEDMITRTIIKKSTKNYVNSSSNSYVSINSDDDDTPLADKAPTMNDTNEIEQHKEYADFEEVTDNVDTETVEIKETSKKESKKPNAKAEVKEEFNDFD